MNNKTIYDILRFCKNDGRDLVFGDINKRWQDGDRYHLVYTLFFDVKDQDRMVLRVTFTTTHKLNLKKGFYVSWELNHYSEFNKKRNSYSNKSAFYYGDFVNDIECKQVYQVIKDLVKKELPGRDRKYCSASCEWLTK